MTKFVILDRDGVINRNSASYVKTEKEWIPEEGGKQLALTRGHRHAALGIEINVLYPTKHSVAPTDSRLSPQNGIFFHFAPLFATIRPAVEEGQRPSMKKTWVFSVLQGRITRVIPPKGDLEIFTKTAF